MAKPMDTQKHSFNEDAICAKRIQNESYIHDAHNVVAGVATGLQLMLY